MPNNYSKIAIGLAAIILIGGAFYVGRQSSQPNTPASPLEVSSSTVTTTASTTTTTPAKTTQTKTTQKTTTSSTKLYIPILTHIKVTTPGNTTILRCTGIQLFATGYDQKGVVFGPVHPLWYSSNTNIATIDQNGVAISSSTGRVIFTARVGTISDSITISVIDSIRPGAGLSPCPGKRR